VIALGLLNPLLVLAATIETGPGQDADCRATLVADPKAKTQAIVKGVTQPASASASTSASTSTSTSTVLPAPVAKPVPASAKDKTPVSGPPGMR